MASLRARLLAGLLALTAAGLLLAGGITYAEQRSFAYQRVDDQTRDAPFVLGRALDGGDGERRPATGRAGRRATAGRSARPPGTYGELRTARARGRSRSRSAPAITAKPDLPRNLPMGRLFTVAAATTAATACSPSATRGPAGS